MMTPISVNSVFVSMANNVNKASNDLMSTIPMFSRPAGVVNVKSIVIPTFAMLVMRATVCLRFLPQ